MLASEIEVEQHELTHLPSRSFCRHCVRAEGKESPHHKSSPGGASKFATDNMFLGKGGTPITNPTWLRRDDEQHSFFATVLPCRSTRHG